MIGLHVKQLFMNGSPKVIWGNIKLQPSTRENSKGAMKKGDVPEARKFSKEKLKKKGV